MLIIAQGAWDNYIANNGAMDPANMWPMNLDLDSMAAPTAQNQGQQGQQAYVNTANTGVFMGATTPGAGGNML